METMGSEHMNRAQRIASVMDDLLALDHHGTAAMGSNTLIHCAPTHSSAISNP